MITFKETHRLDNQGRLKIEKSKFAHINSESLTIDQQS